MDVFHTRMQDGGRIVIPSEIRKALKLDVGDNIVLKVEDGRVSFSTPTQAIARLQKIVDKKSKAKKKGKSIVDELIKDRRREVRAEARKR